MKRTVHIISLFLLLVLPAGAEAINVDSLRQEIDQIVLQQQATEALFQNYRLLALVPLREGKEREAIKIYLEGLAFAEKLKDQRSKVLFLLSIAGLYYLPLDEFTRAREHLLQAKELIPDINDQTLATQCFTQLAEVDLQLGKLNEALEYQLESLSIAEEIKDTVALWNGNYNLGSIYVAKNEYQKALARFKICQDIQGYFSDPSQELSLLIVTGATYVEMDQLDEAVVFIQAAFNLARESEDSFSLAYCEAEMGKIMKKKGELEQARQYLLSALDRMQELDIKLEW
ncbi:MAG: tetratricopeptide repeat protein [Bacteroidota bacterium]